MYIKRIAEKNLKNWLSKDKIIIILGARRVGKTTLVKHFFKDKKASFINLDVEVEKQRFISVSSLPPKQALKSLGGPEILIIDEAQRLAETGRIIKGWYDSKLPVKIILLGSSSLNLLSQSAESLTGRNLKLNLPALTFAEIIKAQDWLPESIPDNKILKDFPNQIKELLIQNLIFGSYPETVTSDKPDEYLSNLVSDYLFKDVLQLGLIKTPELLRKLLLLLAHQIGSEVSVSGLAANLGIARATVERYLDLLERSFVIFRLYAFSSNPRKEIAKSQKIYFWDTGIRNGLINDFSLNSERSDIGPLWENWVIAEFAKQNLLFSKLYELYFWRSRMGAEVDLILKKNERIKAFEIKWRNERKSFGSFTKKYNTKVKIITSSNPFIKL